jgi:hypothetical protein
MRILEAVRSIVKKRYYNTANVSPDSWIKHFGDLFTAQEFDLSVGEAQILSPHYIKESGMDFKNQEVKKFIMSMKNDKATGFDGIPAEAWKVLSTKDEGIGILMDLFNQIKNKKIFPSEWKTTICLIYKGKEESKDEPGYYRGISLLSVLGKMFSGSWLAG